MKDRTSVRVGVVVAMLASLSFLFSGCIDTDTSLRIRNADDMRLAITYRLSAALYEFGVFDDDSQVRPVPISRRDAEITASLHPDAELVGYRSRKTGDTYEISVEYRLRSAAALARITRSFSTQGVLVDWQARELRWVVAPALDEPLREDQATLLTELLRDSAAVFSIEVPAVPTVSGTLADHATVNGRRVQLHLPMHELLLADVEQTLLLRW